MVVNYFSSSGLLLTPAENGLGHRVCKMASQEFQERGDEDDYFELNIMFTMMVTLP